MGDKQHRSPESTPEQGSETDVEVQDELPELSNSEQLSELPTGGATTRGLDNYESTLGKWLGSNLYGAVSDNLEYARFGKHADGVISSAIKAAADQINLLDEYDNVEIDPAAVDAFGEALSQQFAGIGSQWVKGEGRDLVDSLQDWVDANPETVATVALLAAGGAVAANMEIPELKHKFGLTDELSAQVGVQLGRFQDIALEQIEAKLEYHSGPLVLSIQAQHSDGETEGSVGLSYSW